VEVGPADDPLNDAPTTEEEPEAGVGDGARELVFDALPPPPLPPPPPPPIECIITFEFVVLPAGDNALDPVLPLLLLLAIAFVTALNSFIQLSANPAISLTNGVQCLPSRVRDDSADSRNAMCCCGGGADDDPADVEEEC
jgi:hypothetical protein